MAELRRQALNLFDPSVPVLRRNRGGRLKPPDGISKVLFSRRSIHSRHILRFFYLEPEKAAPHLFHRHLACETAGHKGGLPQPQVQLPTNPLVALADVAPNH